VAVSRLEIQSRRPFAEGASHGRTGPYELIEGVMHFAVDPRLPANSVICDIDKAPRDGRGLVEFSSDFWLLQPADSTRGNATLLMEVVNRGRPRMIADFNRVESDTAPRPDTVGDAFLFRHGFTLGAVGWQWDVIKTPEVLGLAVPTAVNDAGQPLGARVIWELQPYRWQPDALLANRVHHPYVAADPSDPSAVLTVREWMYGPRTTVPRERWRFARDEGGRPVMADTHLWIEGGFEAGRIYELIYRSCISPVVGAGLLAYRDATSFLRYASRMEGNPAAGTVRHTLGYGASQSGRFLRHSLYLGLNVDEAGRIVNDGVLPHIAGARRGEFNHRGGQPSLQSATSPGVGMPFSWADQTDPLTGETDGLLRRQRAAGGVPKIIATNTSAEYWRGDAMLSHTSIDGTEDIDPPENVREYLFASTQHMRGVVPLIDQMALSGAHGANKFNAVDYAPLLRAALLNLLTWVRDGIAPPRSVVPRLASGTARPSAEVIAAFIGLPATTLPEPATLPFMRRLDFGNKAPVGVMRYPATMGKRYPSLVSTVDADGNEVAGIRMPDVSVPLATYTGWNPRHPTSGGLGQLLSMLGSTIPFAATSAQRLILHDPRPSLEERYASRDEYAARVRDAAVSLVHERLMLRDDLELVLAAALERYDYFVRLGRTLPVFRASR
jgi:hypothetical protein